MIEENGRVVDVNSQGIWVETVRQSACATCAARNGCGQKLLVSAGAGKRFIIQVSNPNEISVSENDRVILGIEEGAFLKATLFVYLIPLLALFIAALLADYIFANEGLVILSALVGLGIGFFITRSSSNMFFKSCSYQPALLRVI